VSLPAILMDDDPLLRVRSEPVGFGPHLAHLLATMREILTTKAGRGLAAVQIGVPVRVLIVKTAEGVYKAFVNPSITRTLNRFTVEREGCLSVPPRKWGDVSRPAKCDAVWFDEQGEEHSATLTGEEARIFQHEFDHLEGVLITDKMQ
jgi:peptide deformylase